MRNSMNWIKKIPTDFLYLIYLFIIVAVLLEVIFRVLPTSDSLPLMPVNDENPILRYPKNIEVTKQIGFTFKHINTKRFNNYGYASDKNFQEKAKQNKPVISVIGDSYVEALHVKNKNTFKTLPVE